MTTFYQAVQQKNRLAPILLKRAEVIGIGVGHANPKVPSQGACIIVYTHNNLSTGDRLSLKTSMKKAISHISAVSVRIIQRGRFTACHSVHGKAPPIPSWRKRLRPVPGGASIGTAEGTGTAGAIVIDFPGSSQLYILSNNHVLTRNNTRFSIETLQPGPADGGEMRKDRIGQDYLYVPFSKTGVNYIDVALTIPDHCNLLDPRYLLGEWGKRVILPGHLLSYKVGERFKKVGRTTGFVTGTVESIHTDIKVSYFLPDKVTFYYRNQTIIKGSKPIAYSGDSGSVWLRNRDNFAAAVLFAGTEDGLRSVNYPIHWAMQVFQTRIARPSNLAGIAADVPPKGNFAYVQPLSPAELKRIRVVKVKNKKS